MVGLETKVREALIEQRAEELCQALNNPEYKKMIKEITEGMASSMVDSMTKIEDFDEEEKQEMVQEYRNEILPQIQAQYENPEQLKKAMHEQAKNELVSYRQFKAKLRPHFTDLRKDEEIGEDVAKEYEKTYEGLFEFLRLNDKVIKKLAKIAETEGLEKAIQKETRYAIIRELFPTANRYRIFRTKGINTLKKFYQQAQSVLAKDGEAGQMLGEAFGMVEKMIEKAMELGQKSQEDYEKKIIKEIYG